MRRRTARWAVHLAAICTFVPIAGIAQTESAYTPPRTPDGHPDLQGIWQVVNTAAWDLEAHGASLGIPAGLSVVDRGTIPYLPDALTIRRENFEHRGERDPETKCFLPGVPRITYMPYPFRIIQQEDKVSFAYEYLRTIRYVYMNGNSHPPGPIEWWMGDSRGRWDGDTLVVDVIHFNDQTWFDRAGNFHSEALHVVERYSPIGPDHLLYEATIEDPNVFSRPWTIRMPLYRRQEANAELLEYQCPAYLFDQEWDNPDSELFHEE